MKLNVKTFGITHPFLIVAMIVVDLPKLIGQSETNNYGHTFIFDPNKMWANEKYTEYRAFNILSFHAN